MFPKCVVNITVAYFRKCRRLYLFSILACTLVITIFLFASTWTIKIDFAHESSILTYTGNGLVNLQNWKLPHLLNLENFTWVMNNESLCRLTERNSFLLPILVHTARSHFTERLTIRTTWGSLRNIDNWSIRLIFLLGLESPGNGTDKQVEERLLKEQAQFGDIVVGNFIDSYRNMTYKHLMGYKWLLNFCHNATFVLKIDDDMFVNTMKWISWRNKDLKQHELEGTPLPDLYCMFWTTSYPNRDKSHKTKAKWFVSHSEWPLRLYPDYCSGGTYGITVDLIEKIYAVSNEAKYFWVDDVFVTGVLLELAASRLNETHLVKDISNQIVDLEEKCDYSREIPPLVVFIPRKLLENCIQFVLEKIWRQNNDTESDYGFLTRLGTFLVPF